MTENTNKNDKKFVKKINYYLIDKFVAGLSLLAFVVIMIAGFRQDVGVVTITYRAMIAILLLVVAKIIIVKILVNYEETGSE